MKRNSYYSGIFFNGLLIAAALWQDVLRFQVGDQITRLESFLPWLLIFAVNVAIGSFFILKYYHAKHYTVAFITGTLATIAGLGYLMVNYAIIVAPAQFVRYGIPAFFIVFLTSIVSAASLVFSVTRKNSWLLAAGLLMLFLGLALGATILWYNSSQDVALRETLRKVSLWISFVYDLVPLLNILNFRSELKALPAESSDWRPEKTADSVWAIAGTFAFIFTGTLGFVLTNETQGKLAWENQLAIKAKEWATLFESRTFVGQQGDTLRYQLLRPLDVDPQKKYPLVVCLPYGGGVEGCPPAQVLLTDSHRKKYPAFLFVPYCRPGSGWGGVPHYPTVDTLVFDAVLALEDELSAIDENRRYVTGVSRGGYGSWHFICTRPDLFAAAIPVCGGEDPKLAANAVEVSVWAFHGEKDRNVLVQQSRDMIAAIKKAGGHPRYTEFPDAGHDIWDRVHNTSGLWSWLYEQRRDSLAVQE
ncbi:MAG TPA: prolyl oligopeptidase family serine peptidase [Chryseolinea sp.]